ncbi:hypothetical protein AX15_006243 [Amanita polypyramis BW_CC]|nr:hypothetical protein AX15_006243 [Amanita polypyramis BW_CC]
MSSQSPALQQIFSANGDWAREVEKADPEFFQRSAQGQKPHTLWIGCADSRVPESVITKSQPGDIFVHRNVANQLHLDDVNVLSVLAYAVDYLGVEHVVIVGHSQCGGAAACLAAVQSQSYSQLGSSQTVANHPATDPLNRWLAPLTELVASLNLSTMPVPEALPVVVIENVKRQVENLCQTSTIRNAWAKGKSVVVHGWVHDLSTGLLRDLNISRSANEA